MAKKTGEQLIDEARGLWEEAASEDQQNDVEAEKDLKFLALEQWTDEDWRARVKTGRPAFVMDRLNQYVNQVCNDIAMNPPGVKVRPVDGGADVKVAEVFNGLIRNIEAQSNAEAAYVWAARNAISSGRGYFQIAYDYAPGSFEMELGVRRLASPFAARFYAGTLDPTGADAEGCWVSEYLPRYEYEKRFPKAQLIGWEDNTFWGDWKRGDYVRIAEWWRKVPMKRKLVRFNDGVVLDTTDREDNDVREIALMHGGVQGERTAESYRVEMRLINGAEQLEETAEWPSCYLPVVRVTGNILNVGERIIYRSLIRGVRDAQVLLNVSRSSYAEATAMAPKAKWIGTHKQFSANKQHWANANQINLPYLAFTPDEKNPGPPQRVAPDMPAAALLQDVQMAVADIEAGVGIYRENLGKESNAVSGKAILSRQREGDVGTFNWSNGLAGAVMQAGRIFVDMIPKLYDTPRMVRTLGEDGSEDFVRVNHQMQMGDGRIVTVNDLSAGRYDVVASVGPSFSSRREEARESMLAYFQANPQAAQQMGDLFAKHMDWPGADEFAARARRIAIMGGLVDPDPQDPEDAKLIQKMQSQPQQPAADVMLAQAEMAKAQAAQMKAETDRAIEMQRLQLEQAKVQLEAMRLEMEAQQAGQKLSIQAADIASKIEERKASTMREGVKGTIDVVERVVQARQPQMMPGMANQMQAPPGV